jgi:hypothetical protein
VLIRFKGLMELREDGWVKWRDEVQYCIDFQGKSGEEEGRRVSSFGYQVSDYLFSIVFTGSQIQSDVLCTRIMVISASLNLG